ncbi:MAG: alpha/beta hydrolase [Dehalococcoidales bacterium]|nr:alpha/beta hydrolase [Dehalococcoidales bacterium]
MDTIASSDGTFIAYRRSGTGPPMVLVHGTSSSSDRWAAVLPAFESHFTVYAMERRGRGESGDSPEYAIEREFEDVTALVDAVPEPVVLVGHSYGGICALEATLLTGNVKKLVLYEPPIALAGFEAHPPEVVDRLLDLREKDDREGILATFIQDVLQMPAPNVRKWRSSPNWHSRLDTAVTVPREIQSRLQYRFAPDRFANMRIPALMLMGDQSPAYLQEAARTIHSALPASKLVVLPDQGHVAMDTAPDLFARAILDFARE